MLTVTGIRITAGLFVVYSVCGVRLYYYDNTLYYYIFYNNNVQSVPNVFMERNSQCT